MVWSSGWSRRAEPMASMVALGSPPSVGTTRAVILRVGIMREVNYSALLVLVGGRIFACAFRGGWGCARRAILLLPNSLSAAFSPRTICALRRLRLLGAWCGRLHTCRLGGGRLSSPELHGFGWLGLSHRGGRLCPRT